VPNSYEATLAALSPNYYWNFDEAAGIDYVDEVAGLTFNSLLNDTWRRGPGIIRGLPYTYGFWVTYPSASNPTTLYTNSVTAADKASFTTGCLSLAGMLFSTAAQQVLLNLTYDSASAGSEVELRVLSGGKLEFEVNDSSGGQIISVVTDNVAITPGLAFVVNAFQRADGTGLHIMVNGVDLPVTESLTGAASSDSWVADIFASSTGACTSINLNTQNRFQGIGQTFNNSVFHFPAVWINSVPSDAQLGALTAAANFDGVPSDIVSNAFALMNKQGDSLRLGWLHQNSDGTLFSAKITGLCMDIPAINAGNNLQIGSQPGTSTVTLDPSLNPSVPDLAYEYWRTAWNTGTITPYARPLSGVGSIGIPWEGTETTGTISHWVDFDNGVTNGNTRPVFSIDTSNANSYLSFFVGAAAGIYTLTCKVADAAGASYQETHVGLNVSLSENFLLTATQDGSGIRLYLNGDRLSTTPSGALSSASWIDQLATITSTYFDHDASAASADQDWGPNDSGLAFASTDSLTDAEVLQWYQGFIGTFPADTGVAPPPGGFVDTLGETGNSGTGPWHWWRLNELAGFLPEDTGVAPTSGTAITEGGDPDFQVQGPLVLDPTNEAIYFDGVGDYFEVGVDGIAGELVTSAIGTVGFFISLLDLDNDNIAYSQSNDAATAYIKFGTNNGFLEMYVQTSAGNSATYTSSIEILNNDYVYGVITNDGSDYIWYVNGSADASAALTVAGTGLEGDWFDSATWTRSAIAARADSTFDTETTARFSEIFIYEEVLSASVIGALYDAAVSDGIAGAANTNLRVIFEDVIFQNGGLADVRAVNPRTDFSIALQVNRSKFLGGANSATGASVLVSGAVNAQVHGNAFEIQELQTTGRVAIKGTTADPTVAATIFYSLLVSDNTFKGMGRADAAAIFLESGYGATIKANRLVNAFGSAIGWRADAQNVAVLKNTIDTVSTGGGGIQVLNGLNTGVGRNWQILGNQVINALARGISIEAYNSSQAARARHITIAGNEITNAATESIYAAQVRDVRIHKNYINGGTQGIELTTLQNNISVLANRIEGHSAEGIYVNDQNVAKLMIGGNFFLGDLTNDGILIDGISTLQMANNKMVNIANGIQLGNVTIEGKIAGNQAINTTAPFDLVAATTQVGLEIGPNMWSSLGDVQTLTVATTAIDVLAPYHEITSVGATDLDNIGGEIREGRIVVLRVAAGSAIITAKDGTGDMLLSADFAMDPTDSLTLVQNAAGTWNERSRSNNG